MNFPFGQPLNIIAYRDFYDVPRLILARDHLEGNWILDCPFDDKTDEYSQQYFVFFMGTDQCTSKEAYESWATCQRESVGSISVGRVSFDQTRRAVLTAFDCNSANFGASDD